MSYIVEGQKIFSNTIPLLVIWSYNNSAGHLAVMIVAIGARRPRILGRSRKESTQYICYTSSYKNSAKSSPACRALCVSIPILHDFRRVLKHLFLLAYPDSSAKSGKIKPAQCITLSDAAPTTAIAQSGNIMPPS